MAEIIGAITTSHIPAIGKAIATNQQNDPYWKPFFDGYAAAHTWLQEVKPDVAVVFYNDHGLNFFLDKMPTFAVGAAEEYRNEDEGWGLPVLDSYQGDAKFSWSIIEHLVASEFDITTCQQMAVDHGVTVPLTLLWPGDQPKPKILPISINTVQHPLPTAARCFKLGQAVGEAIEAFDSDARVLVLGTGGLSHQLDGERAGFINKKFDLECMDNIVNDPQALTRYSVPELVELAGSQGVEILNWVAMRGVLSGPVVEVHKHYHVPISNTAGALMVMEPEAQAKRRAA